MPMRLQRGAWFRCLMPAAVAALLALFATGPVTTKARADGDPASDVLLGENVFYPFQPPVSNQLQQKLNGETAAAARAHFPIKVALIASPVDLGAIPSLFEKPQQYADFLDQEISFLDIKQLLLVVMPNGYGVRGLSGPAAIAATSLKKPASSVSNDLAQAAIVAVAKLAAAAGHPISNLSGTSAGDGTGGGSTVLTVVLLGLAAVAASAAVLIFRRRRTQLR